MNWQVERKDGSLNILFRVHAKMRGWLALCRMDQLLLLVIMPEKWNLRISVQKSILRYIVGNYMMVVSPEDTVVACSNGQIMFCHEKYCRFHSAVDMITNFNVDAYDFRGCICSESITNQIRQNGGLIDKVFH